MRFTCTRYPQLIVRLPMGASSRNAVFRDGACETDDPVAIRALSALSEGYGIAAVDSDGEAGPPSDPPDRRDRKTDWVDYAVTRGEDRQTAEGMTKAELVERYRVSSGKD